MGLIDLINSAKELIHEGACGARCKCKRSCKAELYWDEDLEKACIKACNGPSPPASGMDFYLGLPDDIRGQIEEDYLDPDIDYQLGESNYSSIYILLGIIAIILLYFYFR